MCSAAQPSVRSKWEAPEPFYRVLAPVLNALVSLLYRIRIRGGGNVPGGGPVLLAANHVSVMDPIVLTAVFFRLGRRARFLALADLFDFKVRGWFLRVTRMIPVVRGAGVDRMVDDACEALAAGQAVVVYPEGRIVPPGALTEGKPGAGLVALRTTAPVVPVGTWGLAPLQGGRWRLRKPVTVIIGAPIGVEEFRADPAQRGSQVGASNKMLSAVRDLVGLAREHHRTDADH